MATISPQRLEALRAMTTQEYLATPEWQATQKHILERDHYQCQGCHAVDVLLHVHHYTYTRQGCELDDDVVTLCEVCRDELHRLMADPPKLSFLKQWGLVGLGTAAIGTIGMEGFVRAPFPAEIGVLIVAFVLAKQSPAIYGKLKEKLSPEILAWLGHAPTSRKAGKPSFLDIWLARTPKLQASDKDAPTTTADRPNNREASDDPDDTLDLDLDEPQLEALTGPSFFKRFPTKKTLKLGKVIATGQRFDPHINQILGDGGIIAGQPGMGKSNLIGLIATGAINCGMTTIVIDYKREFYTLKQIITEETAFCRAGHSSFANEVGEDYFTLTNETASELAEIATSYTDLLIVIDVPSYAGRANELAEALSAFLNALMDQAQAKKEGKRLPCLILVDEAHNYWPEERKLSALSTIKKESFDALQAAHNRIVTGGRSYGFTMIVATQRIANIAKWAIAPLQIKVTMRHGEQNDLKRCKEDIGIDDLKALTALESGQGIVMGLSNEPVTVQFDYQPARHVSVTPKIERVHERQEEPRPRVSQVLARKGQPKRGPTLSQAREVFEPGVSHHDLARILDTDTETAIELFRLLKRLSVSAVSTSGNAGNDLETEAETRPEANEKVITGIFGNVSTPAPETEESSVETNTASVSNEIRETIRRSRNMKPQVSHRTIANQIGLGGRNYKLYQQVCREMGLMSAAEAAEQ